MNRVSRIVSSFPAPSEEGMESCLNRVREVLRKTRLAKQQNQNKDARRPKEAKDRTLRAT